MTHAPVRPGSDSKKKRMSLKLFPFHPSSDSAIKVFPCLRSSLNKRKVHISWFQASVELDQILWINLIAVKNDINLWIGHIVHTTVIKVGEAGIL